VLLCSAYFPPLSWFAAAAKDFTLSKDGVFPSHVTLEACESYVKQSWRNRCRIYASGGTEDLTVPVIHSEDKLITNVLVDWSTDWLTKTKRAVDSAYHTSAFFDYYRDPLYEILDRREDTLWEMNLSIIRFFFDKTGIRAEISFTSEWKKPLEGDKEDYRYAIHPKKEDTVLKDLSLEREYFQVFSHKWGFKGNLSIMDLLFNEGPDSILYLKNL